MKYTILIVFLIIIAHHTVLGQLSIDSKSLEHAFRKSPTDYSHYRDLDFLLNSHYEALTKDQRNSIRASLGTSSFSVITTYSPKERGIKIVIKGKVVDKNQVPIANAKVITFQTDASGSYAPTDSITKRMSEPDSRLYGVLRTDREGNFEIHTVRPGNYPFRYEGRYIPQHVHANISAPGYSSVSLQLVFEDDPSMKDIYWLEWAKDSGFPILKLVPVNGMQTAMPIITLQAQ